MLILQFARIQPPHNTHHPARLLHHLVLQRPPFPEHQRRPMCTTCPRQIRYLQISSVCLCICIFDPVRYPRFRVAIFRYWTLQKLRSQLCVRYEIKISEIQIAHIQYRVHRSSTRFSAPQSTEHRFVKEDLPKTLRDLGVHHYAQIYVWSVPANQSDPDNIESTHQRLSNRLKARRDEFTKMRTMSRMKTKKVSECLYILPVGISQCSPPKYALNLSTKNR